MFNKITDIFNNFLFYIKEHLKINIIFLLLFIVSSFAFTSKYLFFFIAFSCTILLLPILFYHLGQRNVKIILKPKYEGEIQAKTEDVDSEITIGQLMFNYFKTYILFLFTMSLGLSLILISSILSSLLIVSNTGKSLGLIVIAMISVFFLFEGFSILLNMIMYSVIMEKNKVGIFKSIKLGNKFSKKKLMPHMFSVVAFLIVISPTFMLGDVLMNYTLPANILYCFGILLFINYTVFDIKEKLNNFSFEKTSKKKGLL